MNRGYFLVQDNPFNRANCSALIGKRFQTPPSYAKGVWERDEFTKMTDMELVAYWNILQFGLRMLRVDPDNQTERHLNILGELFAERGIPYELGKRIIIYRQAA